MRFRPATPRTLAIVTLILAALAFTGGPAPVRAQSDNAASDNAAARVHFEEGNRHFARAQRLRGARQRRALEEALAAYMETLSIVRSRNALFNTAMVLEQLDRHTEAFAYLREYLAIRGLTDDERREGETRMAAIRERVAVVSAVSEPAGAQVYVDRLDLAPRGRAPLEVALEPGSHRIYFRLPHHQTAEVDVEATVGQSVEARGSLTAEPVAVTLEVMAPANTPITLDGEPAEAGTVELAPGLHVARLEPEGGTPVERRFEVRPGEPMRVRLELGATAVASRTGQLRVVAKESVLVSVDGAPVGEGTDVRVELPEGSHLVEVRAPGHEPIRRSIQMRHQALVHLEAELDPSSRPLGVLPHIALGLTGASLVATLGLGIHALKLNDDNERACMAGGNCAALGEEVDDANRRADILLGVTGGLALTTLILYVINRPNDDSRLVQVAVDRNGGSLTIGGRF